MPDKLRLACTSPSHPSCNLSVETGTPFELLPYIKTTFPTSKTLKLLNKQVFGECSKYRIKSMARKRLCDVSEDLTHSCVMCVPVDTIWAVKALPREIATNPKGQT